MKIGFKEPESMDDLIYFTNRILENNGKIKAWVCKIDCPECKSAKMGKPVEKGKVKIRAKEYICPKCGYTEEKSLHEEKLPIEIIYTCPYCSHSDQTATIYKRKTYQGVPSYVFDCQGCGKKIAITKKMKKPKKK